MSPQIINYTMRTKVFATPPSSTTVQAVLDAFGLASLTDSHYFTRRDLARLETAARLTTLGVRGLYVPSRAVPAIDTDLRALVVLKHVVATCGYVLKRQRAVPTTRYCVAPRAAFRVSHSPCPT